MHRDHAAGHYDICVLEEAPDMPVEHYLAEMEAFRKRLRQSCERNDCHFASVSTADSMREVLASYLAFRRKTATN